MLLKKIFTLVVCLTTFTSITQGQPTAAFESFGDAGCSPINLSFSDQSTSTEVIESWFWDFGDGTTSTSQNPNHSYYFSGTYSVCLEVTDALSQTDQVCEPLIVMLDTIIMENVDVIHISCHGESTGSIDITASGGTVPYVYTWSNGAATEDVSGLSAGDYLLTVTDGDMCSATFSFIVNEPSLLLLDVLATCATSGQGDGTLTALVTGGVPPYSYDWSNGIISSTNENITAGVYGITVTDTEGCTVSDDVVLSEGTIEAEIQGTFDYCLSDAMSLCAEVTNGEPGDVYSYDWTGPGGFQSTEECISIDSLYGFIEGLYSVNITDANGCDVILSQEISVVTIDEVIISVGSDVAIVCEDETVQLEVVPVGNPANYTYEWSPSSMLNDPTIANPTATINATTWFSVIVTDLNGCGISSNSISVFFDEDCMWPGDTDTNNVVNNLDLLNIGLGYDSLSAVRPNASLNWVAQANYDWSGNLTGTDVNKKHIDCNGDGIINSDDTLAITLNWGEMHDFWEEEDDSQFGPIDPQSNLTVTVPFYVEPDTLIENESFALPIILGEEGNEAENIYGLAFTLEYDSSVIVPGSVSVGYAGWLGTNNVDLLAIQKTFISPGRVDVAMTRIDGIEMSGFGQLATLYITIEDDVLLRADSDSRDDAVVIEFDITNVRIIDRQGEEVPVVPMETTTIIEEPLNTKDINWDEYIQIAPNPADEVFYLTTKNIEIKKLKLLSINGELLLESKARSLKTEVKTNHLNPGMYLLEVQTDLGLMVKKIVVMR